MKIRQLQEKYELSKDDFWELKRGSRQTWIITHDACEKIAFQEGIIFESPQVYIQSPDNISFIGAGKLGDRIEWTTGEASPQNCKMSYFWAMAEKRLKDRLTLKLINAYEYGIYSEAESDSFSKGTQNAQNTPKEPTKKQIGMLGSLCTQLGIGVDITGMSRKDVSEKIDELQGEVSIKQAQKKSDDYEREYNGKEK